MKVHLFRSKDVPIQLVKDVFGILVSGDSPFDFVINNKAIRFQEETVEWTEVVIGQYLYIRENGNTICQVIRNIYWTQGEHVKVIRYLV